MRILHLAATASLCLLAACNGGTANNSANAPAPATDAPAESAAPPAATPAPAAGGGDRRSNEIAECVAGAPGNLPAGTDANAFCTCAVDKIITGNMRQRDAINECSAEMNIPRPNEN